jgi:hypothetical protein
MTINCPHMGAPPDPTQCPFTIPTKFPLKVCMKNTQIDLTKASLCLIIDVVGKQEQEKNKKLKKFSENA